MIQTSDYEKRIKILFLSHERKMGGANMCLYELAKEMKNRGHEVYVTVLFKNCPLALKLREANVNVIPCFYGWWQMPEFWNIFLKTAFRILHALEFIPQKKLERFATKNKIDVIYSNTSCIDIGMKISQDTGIKHVWHFREFGKSDYGLEYIQGRRESIEQVKQGADRIIFISEKLRSEYSDIDFDFEDKVSVIYDGVSIDNVNPNKKHNESKLVFLITGNISSTKNQMLALQATEILKGLKFELWIAGECTSMPESKKYKQDMIDYISDNNLDNVRMLGFVEDMKSLRDKADIEIVASRSEGFGRVTVEAMMSGNPVIASNSGANPELISHGETGWLFESNNANALAAAMKTAMNMEESILDEMGQNASRNAIERFSLKTNMDNMERVFREVTSPQSQSSQQTCS